VETSDDNPPEFEFDYVPGGDGKLDSINMYDCCVNNIENVELDSMWDGCWEDIVFPNDMDEEEQERLMELIEESSIYEVLEEDEGWQQNDCDAWIWGPIVIEDAEGNQVRIICADDDGTVIDFKEDTEEETEQAVIDSMPVWPFPTNNKENSND
jgi:hypothetical protein